jgi:hypothetical protein
LLLAGLAGADEPSVGGFVKSKPSGEAGFGTCGFVKSKSDMSGVKVYFGARVGADASADQRA